MPQSYGLWLFATTFLVAVSDIDCTGERGKVVIAMVDVGANSGAKWANGRKNSKALLIEEKSKNAMVCSFSTISHLLSLESYCYALESQRLLHRVFAGSQQDGF